ncbi:Gramicidin S synthase 2 [Grimontia marina]|uniref:Gramicidin S synthase 2 n=1 Tax=Grimontia marina TaxID=646534 RepID=A0A128F6L1_9GAMM|nr:Gramicidin S synthase 2 [Grimontia marina]
MLSPAGQPASLAAALLVDHTDDTDTEQFKADVTDQLRALLPDYMVPSTLALVDEIPLSANGKVDRKTLSSLLNRQTENSYEAPRDSIEEQIAEIWASELGVDQISRNDNFFMIGGDSLAATRIVQAMQQQRISPTGVTLSMLFTAPSVAEFAMPIKAQWQALSEGDKEDTEIFEEGSL